MTSIIESVKRTLYEGNEKKDLVQQLWESFSEVERWKHIAYELAVFLLDTENDDIAKSTLDLLKV